LIFSVDEIMTSAQFMRDLSPSFSTAAFRVDRERCIARATVVRARSAGMIDDGWSAV
jgi:hypothetical protein